MLLSVSPLPLLRLRVPASSACIHLDYFSSNDCHSHNYNNYNSNDMILNGLGIFLLRMVICSGWG